MKRKSRIQIFAAKILNNSQVGETVFGGGFATGRSGFNHGAFTIVIPRCDLDDGRGVGHGPAQSFTQGIATLIVEMAIGGAPSGLPVDVVEPGKGRADVSRPG